MGLGLNGARVGVTPPKAGRQEVWTDVSAARLDARYKIDAYSQSRMQASKGKLGRQEEVP